ncbi:glycosyltransferase family 4 protein [Herpetosiphon giganteus]|uniref:glycosyltransferase family 4 protein n=1 Tax=Herpetosiphon giganteus TaxID=2029754 RepID=UPI001958C594|nr:glycosyltransferase family 4 protein [Herpetosiphon giganteus]MBM7841717.1 glycosyltransferase involved in cell wall biosynthesis [Herpetosiphon giganteus]
MNQPLVLHIATADMGLRFLLLEQLQAIQHAGYQVRGVASDGPYRAEVEAAGIPVEVVTMPRSVTPTSDLVAVAKLVRLFRRLKPTIVHTHNPKPGLLGQLAARLAGVPIIINTIHGFYFHEHSSPKQRHFYIAMEKIAARCSHAILSQNREDLATALATKIARPEQISLLGNGINLDVFDRRAVSQTEVAAARQALGIPADAQVIGAVGRLVAEKGYHELFRACQQLMATRPNVHLLVVGPEEPHKADGLTAASAADYGIAERSHFAGMRRDMPVLYHLMDVLAHPSYREGFPRAPMEASAMGVPVVASAIRGCRETVAHGLNGMLVPVRDAAALAQSLGRILDDRVVREAFSRLARQVAEREFDQQRVFERVLLSYAEQLQARGLAVPAPIRR